MDIAEEHRLRTRTTAVVLDWAAEREPPFRGEDKAGYGEAIVAAHIVADEARLTLHRWIDAARRADLSWSEIGEVLGISKQAAQQRFRALTTTDTSMAEAEVVRTGATAFNEMRILADEGRQGHELTGVGVLTLTFRTSDRQWEYCRRVGSGSDTARLKDAGWEHVASYLPFHYYKRAMG
ncbi:hypothetical protein ASG37_00650 [Sphingomonas sp. Leaf407]|uniref:hypothetical protein n=1 Tax=unclassified Sphingomonas TaxID=196159 RepID=UPI0006FD43A4|nr:MULTISPECIES: hypothetical protein [unclassified Sphingomonas]KQN40355.1 hypothetical protein ASE97_00680 [Sphingomonas sp. Leaf42]KQT29709.1 hypothetical protein ASG37_00650 [Sphingomonas sp. Leaf407]